MFDGTVDFVRDWITYRDGFGDVYGEHWTGNEFVHQYTEEYSTTEMIAVSTAFDGVQVAAKFKNFGLGDETSKYLLTYDECIGLPGIFNGCSDWSSSAKDQKFSTLDSDNDRIGSVHCSLTRFGGWWYKYCFDVKLTGIYDSTQSSNPENSGQFWKSFRGYTESLKGTKMLVRRQI